MFAICFVKQKTAYEMRISDGSSDVCSSDLLARIDKYTQAGEAKSIALLGNAAEILPQLVERGVRPDAVTDQTSAHDPVHGYLPIGWTVEQWRSEEHTSELQSLMRISYAVFRLKKKSNYTHNKAQSKNTH